MTTKPTAIPACSRSSATPLGAKTTTTPTGKTDVKKDIDLIIAAHEPPYQATACAAYPQDLFKKVAKALTFRGPTFIHVLAPCPPGWRYSTEKSVEMGKLAVRTGHVGALRARVREADHRATVESGNKKTGTPQGISCTPGKVQGDRSEDC